MSQVIFEPLIRTDKELNYVLRALRVMAGESQALASYASSGEVMLRYESEAADLQKLIVDISARLENSRRARA